MKEDNNKVNKNFINLALTIEKMAKKELKEPGLLKALDDALSVTLDILNNSFILGKNAEKVNVLKSFWGVLKSVVEESIKKDKKENGNDNKEEKNNKASA